MNNNSVMKKSTIIFQNNFNKKGTNSMFNVNTSMKNSPSIFQNNSNKKETNSMININTSTKTSNSIIQNNSTMKGTNSMFNVNTSMKNSPSIFQNNSNKKGTNSMFNVNTSSKFITLITVILFAVFCVPVFADGTFETDVFINETDLLNKCEAAGHDIKGSLTEDLMDDFFTKDGWEKFDGKIGRNGFDGLYVKRRGGQIVDWLPVEAKSGSATLQETMNGRQLSPEWIQHNLKLLKEKAQSACRLEPSPANLKRMADLEQISKLGGRKPRLFRTELVSKSGQTICRFKNIGLDGNKVSEVFELNLSQDGRLQQKFFSHLEKQIRAYTPSNATKITNEISKSIKCGKISCDSDFHRAICNGLHQMKKVEAVKAISTTVAKVPTSKVKTLRQVEKAEVASAGAAAVGKTVSKDTGKIIGKGKQAIEKSGVVSTVSKPVAKVAKPVVKAIKPVTKVIAPIATVAGPVVTVVDAGMTIKEYADGEISGAKCATKIGVDAAATAIICSGGPAGWLIGGGMLLFNALW